MLSLGTHKTDKFLLLFQCSCGAQLFGHWLEEGIIATHEHIVLFCSILRYSLQAKPFGVLIWKQMWTNAPNKQVIFWGFESFLWLWLWRQQSKYFARYSSSWYCSITQSSVAKSTMVHKIWSEVIHLRSWALAMTQTLKAAIQSYTHIKLHHNISQHYTKFGSKWLSGSSGIPQIYRTIF